MFYRRKVILALLELLNGESEKLRLQKLLFLYTMKKPDNPEYDFIPYKFGCYSYSANADMNAMVRRGFLDESETLYKKKDKGIYLSGLKSADQMLLKRTVADYGDMSSSALIKHTYLNFPFYSIHSTIAEEVLPGKLYERVEKEIPKQQEMTLFTIGYEGISLEQYLQKLIRNNVKLLVDVRKNPLSMKFGFSKTLLKRYCNSVKVEYIHIPEVGIESEKRKSLKDQSDYDALFKSYRTTTLKHTSHYQNKIYELLKENKRIALTCFEAEPCQCHRTHLANSITKLPGFNHSLVHL